MTLPLKQRVKIICGFNNIKMGTIAEAMGMSSSSLTQRLDRGKLTKQELIKLAEIIGCVYQSSFVFSSGKAFSACAIGDQIMDALAYANMTVEELGEKSGLVYAKNIAGRIATGKFTQEELEKIAGYIGCTYVSEFILEDGTVI